MTAAHPELSPVQSSNIAAAAHSDGALYIKFNSGAVWKYADVPAHIYDEMLGSSSIGKYFAQFVKPTFKAEKVAG